MTPADREALTDSIARLRTLRATNPALYAGAFKTLGALIWAVRCDLEDARDDAAPVATVAPKTTADSLAELVESYQTAAMITGSYAGATSKQAAFLAKLHWADGERRLWDGPLTKREASSMINIACARA